MWHWEFDGLINGWERSRPGYAGHAEYESAKSAMDAFYRAHHERSLGSTYRLLRGSEVIVLLVADVRAGIWHGHFTDGTTLTVDLGW